MNIGILGSAGVGRALGSGFHARGDAVVIGTRDPASIPDDLVAWLAAHPGARAGTFAEAAEFGEVLVLAVKGRVATEALALAGAAALGSKVIIDATNPISEEPPVDGVLNFFTSYGGSLMEELQRQYPDTRMVKAFNSVGAHLMVNPALPGGPPTMFICGNDAPAKRMVAEILTAFGWETSDLGTAVAARAIEPLCILWCIPGFRENAWVHAFKLLRPV
jgi:8-hydroxy-5-deazaflavin:NADPH oxidoreductase